MYLSSNDLIAKYKEFFKEYIDNESSTAILESEDTSSQVIFY